MWDQSKKQAKFQSKVTSNEDSKKKYYLIKGSFKSLGGGGGADAGWMGREGMRVAKLSWKWFGEIWS